MKKKEMQKTVRKRHSLFTVWEFDAAAEEFTRMSEQGWHVTKAGFYTQTYVYNPALKYRYQIDYNDWIGDPARYNESFADAGWMPVECKLNGWNVFAKEYADGQPEESYMIYTDGQSKAQMYRRARRFVGLALIVWIFCLVLDVYSVITGRVKLSDFEFTQATTPLLQFINVYLFSRWYFSVRSLEKGKKPRRFHYLAFMLIAGTVILVSMGILILDIVDVL